MCYTQNKPYLTKLSRKAGIIVLSSATVIVALGGTSAYAAHTNALPGSALYPFKKGWEEARILLSLSPASEAQTRVDIAHNLVQATQQLTPTPSTNVLPALQEAQQQLNSALNQSNKVSDPSKRQEIKDSISKEAADASVELEQHHKPESSNDKRDAKNTAEQLQQIKNKASGH